MKKAIHIKCMDQDRIISHLSFLFLMC